MIDLSGVGFIHVDHDRNHHFALRIDRQAGTGALLAAGMGGTLSARNRSPRGAEFRLTLPLAAA